jgi:hypothetical protein
MPTRGQTTPDEFLRSVAQLYESHVRSGSTRATADVAADFAAPRSTAARWVMEARRRGMLPPAQRGAAGVPTGTHCAACGSEVTRRGYTVGVLGREEQIIVCGSSCMRDAATHLRDLIDR